MEEKPIECGSCKRRASITFKEIADGKTRVTQVCSECPYLQSKVGLPTNDVTVTKNGLEGSVCKNCQTTHQSLAIGQGVGCEMCYETFEEVIVNELTHANLLPNQYIASLSNEAKAPLHFGNIQESRYTDLTLKLESLNKALSEALQLENYERAASLRDEIKTLMDNPNG